MSQPALQSTNDIRRAVLLLLGVGGLLGTSAVVAKLAPTVGWSPLPLLQWSMLLGGGLQLILWLRRRSSPISPSSSTGETKKLLTYMALSGILFAVPNAMAFAAVKHVGAGFVALCFAFPLMLTYGLALLLGMEKVQANKLLAVVAGVTGGVVLALDKGGVGNGFQFWALIALAVPVIIAGANIYRTTHWPKGAQADLLSVGMLLFGGLTMVPINAAFGLPFLPAAWTIEATGLLIGQGLVFAVMYDLYFRLQKLAGPVYLSQIGSVAAVTGVALAFVVFGEIPGVGKLTAAALIGIGILLMNLRKRANAADSSAPETPAGACRAER